MKIVTVLGARPQFVKAAMFSKYIQDNLSNDVSEVIIHTGQHYDANMSDIFFTELSIPTPKYNLGITASHHGEMTGLMLTEIERVLLIEKPNLVLVYGDTNSTIAAALAAAKLHIPIAHIESGLRSFNMKMPEEINRIVTDKLSTFLYCPTKTAVKNLSNEGIRKGVYNVGDIMYDAALFFDDMSAKHSTILEDLKIKKSFFVLATCHRAENTNSPERLSNIVLGLSKIANDTKVVLPLHPRTLSKLKSFGLYEKLNNIEVVEPLSYLDMIALEKNAEAIITDSGGMQKEAFFFQKPCITLRDETEWVETIELGWNTLVGADEEKIYRNFLNLTRGSTKDTPYGTGNTCQLIAQNLVDYCYA